MHARWWRTSDEAVGASSGGTVEGWQVGGAETQNEVELTSKLQEKYKEKKDEKENQRKT